MTRRAVAAGGATFLAWTLFAEAAAPRHRKSPFVEIVADATVVTAPRETLHKNGRKYLEFEVVLSSARLPAEQPDGADKTVTVDTKGRVKVVHDLSCGGAPVRLGKGDRIQIGGEYVHVPQGGDVIHFTHPADGTCGSGGKHPAGFLRVVAAPAGTPRPIVAVPDQPFVGTPRAVAKPYETILAAKENGATNAELQSRVGRERVVYSLTTPEIQKLRAAGVSEEVIEAMLRSGRTPAAPTPSPTPR